MNGFTYSVCSGCLAALASVLGKLAFTPGPELLKLIDLNAFAPFRPLVNLTAIKDYLLVINVTCFILMVLTNGLMWTTFTKALAMSAATIEATVVNTASNFIVTAFLGITLFGELIGLVWCLGSIMILIGLVCVKLGSGVEVKQVKDQAHRPQAKKVKSG